jgi:hypothetical protein
MFLKSALQLRSSLARSSIIFCARCTFSKRPLLALVSDLAPWRLSCALRYDKRFGYQIFNFARVTTTAVCLSFNPGTTTRKHTPRSKSGYGAGALGGKHLRYAPQIFFPTVRTFPLQPMIWQNAKVRAFGFAWPCTKAFAVNAHPHSPSTARLATEFITGASTCRASSPLWLPSCMHPSTDV